MKKLFVFMGKSAVGKDTLFAKTMSRHPELRIVVTYTTRPIREGEKNGDEYYFTDEENMNKMRADGRVIEVRCYNTVKGPWYYFTAENDEMRDDDNPYAMITTLEGYNKIREYYGDDMVVPIYITVPDIVRMERSISREKKEENPCVAEVCRRYLADEEDFSPENLKKAQITESIDNLDMDKALEQIDMVLAKNLEI
ncbi:MAG: guanylate kinase [Eubacterium sp.]|nr:guanylate kinase [Eubacterium sp.]